MVDLPDLVIVDGGKGQLNAALARIERSTSRFRSRISQGERGIVPPWSPGVDPAAAGLQALFLVQRVRDEAHRFAVTFHRARRSRRPSVVWIHASVAQPAQGIDPQVRLGTWHSRGVDR